MTTMRGILAILIALAMSNGCTESRATVDIDATADIDAAVDASSGHDGGPPLSSLACATTFDAEVSRRNADQAPCTVRTERCGDLRSVTDLQTYCLCGFLSCYYDDAGALVGGRFSPGEREAVDVGRVPTTNACVPTICSMNQSDDAGDLDAGN